MAKQRTTSRGGEDPDSDDALAFRAAVRDVKPLAQKPIPAGLASPRPRRRKPAASTDNLDADNLDIAMPLVGAVPITAGNDELPAGEAVSGGDALSFQRAGVRAQVVRRLRRGLFPIDDELDLHGLSQTAARDQLAQFLAFNRAAGRRCVRIIHGKGYRSGARGPILKIAVNLWLRRHPDVMAFTSARAIDGGTGAVYVLLRA
jgi:DNA-nicking Smr family endonuclease